MECLAAEIDALSAFEDLLRPIGCDGQDESGERLAAQLGGRSQNTLLTFGDAHVDAPTPLCFSLAHDDSVHTGYVQVQVAITIELEGRRLRRTYPADRDGCCSRTWRSGAIAS